MKALTGIAAALVLLIVPSTAFAQAELPVGEAEGVRVVRERGAVVVVFTARAAKLYKRIAGKLVRVACSELAEDDGPGFSSGSSGSVSLRAPPRRGKLRTGDRTRGMDYCRVWLASRTVTRKGERTRIPSMLVVSVPVTQKGAVFLDEEAKSGELLGGLALVSVVAERRNLDVYPTYAQLVDAFPKVAQEVTALANPTDSPPRGRVGYYSDGQQHVVFAVLSASGRRLFLEFAADEVLSTNVAGHIFGERD